MNTQNQSAAQTAALADTAPQVAQAPRSRLVVNAYGASDRGRVRENNEDQFVVATLTGALWIQQSSYPHAQVRYGDEAGNLFVVADGMGGHAGGEQASALAVDTVEHLVLGGLDWIFSLGDDDGLLRELRRAMRRADARVFDEAARRPELRGMGTTLTLAYSAGSELFVAHAGDSRAYLLRRGRLHRLTEDHTLVREMVKGGVLRASEVDHHALRHVVTNIVGGPNRGVQAELRKIDLEAGDVLLLCSDGLTEMVRDDEITAILSSSSDARSAAESLVARANELGGKDNVTVVVASYQGR